MELVNSTRMEAGYSIGIDPAGREHLVVVIKGTFALPRAGEKVRLLEEQLPLVMADTYTGEPGRSAPVHEVDFALHKRACDVLLNGSAYAPAGRQTPRQIVGLRCGTMNKSFDVVGDRVWQAGLTTILPSAAQPYVRMPISYDVAFGGVDVSSEDEQQHAAYAANPVGRGWHKSLRSSSVDGKPLPNTEETGQPIGFPSTEYKPVSFGPLARSWPSRARHAGTYDDQWLADVFPFLPKDFDDRYYQAAPEDQQIEIPTEPLLVQMINLTPDNLREFSLPSFEAPVHIFPKQGPHEDHVGKLDTILFEPDHERFTMNWRVTRPLKRSLHEIGQVVVGRKGTEWWQQRGQVGFPIPVVMVPMRSDESGHAEDAAS